MPEPKREALKNLIYIETDWGRLGLAERGGRLTDIFWAGDLELISAREHKSPLLTRAERQIREYLAGQRKKFSLPVELGGTDFQKTVLAEVMKIPYGQTRSYQDIARAVGHPRAARAVGAATRTSTLSMVTPCHRVLRADGSLSGPGDDTEMRKRLLRLEAEAGHPACPSGRKDPGGRP